jgi:hypothetical protein
MLGGAGTRSMFGRTTLAGSYLFTVNLETRFKEGGNGLAALPALSPALLDEFNAVMAASDTLLARSGANLSEEGEQDVSLAPRYQFAQRSPAKTKVLCHE